jgi:general secretion pathway protein C
MLARLTAFTVWALVAATAVFWGLRLFVRAQPAPAYAVAVGESTAQRGDLGRLLGVMAAKAPSTSGFATIAVDSKPARTYAVGAALDGELVLQSVSLRSAAIGPAQGSPAVTLEIPQLPPPATGSLPPVSSDGLRPVAPPAAPPIRPAPPGQIQPGQTPPPPQPLPGRLPRTPGVTNR